jgi:hypothetical protein
MNRSIAGMAGPSLVGIVNPDLLKWARKACSLDLEGAARKLGTTAARSLAWKTIAVSAVWLTAIAIGVRILFV